MMPTSVAATGAVRNCGSRQAVIRNPRLTARPSADPATAAPIGILGETLSSSGGPGIPGLAGVRRRRAGAGGRLCDAATFRSPNTKWEMRRRIRATTESEPARHDAHRQPTARVSGLSAPDCGVRPGRPRSPESWHARCHVSWYVFPNSLPPASLPRPEHRGRRLSCTVLIQLIHAASACGQAHHVGRARQREVRE